MYSADTAGLRSSDFHGVMADQSVEKVSNLLG